MSCKTCHDRGEVLRFTSSGYDQPVVPEWVTCPECAERYVEENRSEQATAEQPTFTMPEPKGKPN